LVEGATLALQGGAFFSGPASAHRLKSLPTTSAAGRWR